MKKFKHSVLIVDDVIDNVDILSLDLKDAGYNVFTAFDGLEGWSILNENIDQIDVILLDRMMPNMNGMEFLQKAHATSAVQDIPIIMQTAAAQPSQISEGIQSGVFYYLTKPYDVEVMLSLVKAAIDDKEKVRSLRKTVTEFEENAHLIKNCNFEFSSLEEAKNLTPFLASLFPNREQVSIGLLELLINAVEHGNLEISYDDKTSLNKSGSWEKEVDTRLNMEKFKNRKVHVEFVKRTTQCEVKITDQGSGFSWRKYMEIDVNRATDNHGRGIAMANMLSFDELRYNECGNVVTGKVFFNKKRKNNDGKYE